MHRVLGTLAIYHREINQPSAADITLIEQCADLISVALDKNAAEVQLHDSERQLALVLEIPQAVGHGGRIRASRPARKPEQADKKGAPGRCACSGCRWPGS